jgi:RNA polymerase sigma factor (sigma-70 family)
VSSESQGPNVNINRLYETARSGDRTAEDRLFEYLSARFQVFARLRLTNRQETEDIVQEALAAIAGEYRDITFASSFAAWAYKVLDNRILAYLQTKKRRGDRLEPDPYGTMAADSAADNPDPDLKRRLLDCLRKLLGVNPRYARALSQHYQGYSTAEICARIGIKANTFYSLLSRARSMLDNCLEKGEIS